ncbi:unnamed protein product [Amoebophrya sp. A25]|nr:unnamed protein product [Amoebophrya sp. A25]|eukprot:GSA25T00005589001.1
MKRRGTSRHTAPIAYTQVQVARKRIAFGPRAVHSPIFPKECANSLQVGVNAGNEKYFNGGKGINKAFATEIAAAGLNVKDTERLIKSCVAIAVRDPGTVARDARGGASAISYTHARSKVSSATSVTWPGTNLAMIYVVGPDGKSAMTKKD